MNYKSSQKRFWSQGPVVDTAFLGCPCATQPRPIYQASRRITGDSFETKSSITADDKYVWHKLFVQTKEDKNRFD